jgi:hypothetical protein
MGAEGNTRTAAADVFTESLLQLVTGMIERAERLSGRGEVVTARPHA